MSQSQSSLRSSRMIGTVSAMFSQLWHWLSFIGYHFKSGQSQDAHQSIQRESESIQTESESDQSELTLKSQSEEKLNQIKVNQQHASA
eukprot:5455217-Amphidinium_carterae.1